jgi:hypothetical protein
MPNDGFFAQRGNSSILRNDGTSCLRDIFSHMSELDGSPLPQRGRFAFLHAFPELSPKRRFVDQCRKNGRNETNISLQRYEKSRIQTCNRMSRLV